MARTSREPVRDDGREALERQVESLQRELATLRAERAPRPEADSWYTPGVLSVLFLGLFGALWYTYAMRPRHPRAADAVVEAPSTDYNPSAGAAPPPAPTPAAAPTPAPAPAPAEGSAHPTADEVADALRSVFPAATECAHGAHGINVSLTFVPAGTVGTVNVTGASDDAVRDCIVRAVRAGHVPAYSGPPRDANFAL